MPKLFHVSRPVTCKLSLAALCTLATFAAVDAALASDISYMGRWTVSDDKPAYSSKGIFYKTIDVAPCGADFCGVSVSDKGSCGPTLFRFLTAHSANTMLTGHGIWGEAKRKLQVEYVEPNAGENPKLLLGIGDDKFDFESREGSMPTFEANYAPDGKAQCTAR